MKIILIGANGKMGKAICEMAENGDDEIVAKIDKDDCLKQDINYYADVIIDFSTCENRQELIEYAKKHKLPYCCFSTGLPDSDIKNLKNLSKFVPVLVCSNASVCVNLMFEIVDTICKKLQNTDIVLTEYHHKLKKDTPSGTAKKLQNIVENNEKTLQISAFRVGNEFGTHKVQFFIKDELLEITHRANSRKIFAVGALKMAKELLLRPCGFYER